MQQTLRGTVTLRVVSTAQVCQHKIQMVLEQSIILTDRISSQWMDDAGNTAETAKQACQSPLNKENRAIRTKAWKIDMEGKKPLKTLCPQALMARQTCLIHIVFGETQDQLCCHLQTSGASDCGSTKLVPMSNEPSCCLHCQSDIYMSAKCGYRFSCVDT